MPQLPVPTLSETLKKGYVFTKDRFEGEEYRPDAHLVAIYLKRHMGFKDVGVHTGKDWDFRGGKRIDYEYYKVYVTHPTDADLYAWWTPKSDGWGAPFDFERATWFEFQDVK